jgi:hypothetical protein
MYSREFVELNINYARTVVEKTGLSFIDAVSLLTCVRRTILGVGFGNNSLSEGLWQSFVSRPGDDPAATIMSLQDLTPEKVHEDNRVRSGRLSATLPNEDGLSLIHFSEDRNERNPLGGEGLKRRIEEMKMLLKLLNEYGPTHIGMFSWLLDGRFGTLFPKETEYLNNPNAFYQSLAVWGQYLRYNGSLNRDRAGQLMTNANAAENVTELQAAHPKKALQARVLADKMFLMYGIK